MKRKLLRVAILFSLGGTAYILIELVCRGFSHYTMFLAGGVCFLIIGSLNNLFPWELSILTQMWVSSVAITATELIFGLIFNRNHTIWDYSDLPYNLFGQICLLFSNIWFYLSFVGILLDDLIRWKMFRQRFPKYKL